MVRIITTHPLFEIVGTAVGVVLAQELRDGVQWLVVEFEGYGTHADAAVSFFEV